MAADPRRPSRGQKRLLLGAAALLGLWVAIALVGRFGPGATSAPDREPAALAVELETATPRRFEDWRRYPGTIEAERDIRLKSRVTGEVDALPGRTGSRLQRGDLAVAIEAETLEHERDRRLARVEGLEHDRAMAERRSRRRNALYADELIAEEDIEQARNRLTSVTAALEEGRAALAAAEEQLSHTRVEAPFTGLVGHVLVEVGEMVAPGTPLLELVDPTDLKATFTLPAKDQGLFSEGAEVRIQHAERQWAARLDRRHPRMDGPGRGIAAEALLTTDAPPPPGLDVDVRVRASVIDNALTVPAHALHDEADRTILYVEVNGEARRRVVERGPEAAGRVVIRDGLAAGERVITTPHPELAPGRAIREGVRP